jgi:hypothetical protein
MEVHFTNNKRISFADLNIGDSFVHNDKVFMKTDITNTSYSVINAVCLNDGKYEYFIGTTQVENIKIVVEVGRNN